MTDTDSRPGAPGAAAGGPDPRVLAMARAFDRTRRKVEGLDTHVAQLSADVTRLGGVGTAQRPLHTGRPPDADPPNGAPPDEDGADGMGGVPAVRSWLLAADREQAGTDLADLVEWLDRVYLRYPGAELSACWLWHPHVIEELWWLRRAHADAFHPKDGSWLRVGDWHDRQRPAVTKRVRDAVGNCDLSLHDPSKPHGQPPAVAPLARHAAAIAAAWATGGTRPEPTTEQLAEGAAYFQALYRSQR
ncbi:MAG: hypothetical protein L0H64_23700 [Pseudonocardia sp.]|nr:hypothetical protein [Pseudonocardia sp.]